jgi:hypothetical protein
MDRTLLLCHIAFDAGVVALSCCEPLEKKLEDKLLDTCFHAVIAVGFAVLKELLAIVQLERDTFEAILPMLNVEAAMAGADSSQRADE